MDRLVPRDRMLLARLGGFAGILIWSLLTWETIDRSIAAATGLVVLASIALTVRRELRATAAAPAARAPLVLDLLASAMWMAANARHPQSIAFVIVLIVAAVVTFEIGLRALALGAAAYVAGRLGQELVRVLSGSATPPIQVVAEVPIAGPGVFVTGMSYLAFRGQQERGARALALARTLERLATDITAETDLDAVFRSIVRSSLELIEAQHAVRDGEMFRVIAGAGTGGQVVGVRVPQNVGLVGDILRERRTVAVADYPTHPTAVAQVVAIGVHAVVCLPIFVNGELAATLTVGRLDRRAIDAASVAALEGLASYATIAVRNARLRERARALERLSLAVMQEQDADQITNRIVSRTRRSSASARSLPPAFAATTWWRGSAVTSSGSSSRGRRCPPRSESCAGSRRT